MDASESELYLTDRAVALRYGISRSSVWRLVAQGHLPSPIRLAERITRWSILDLRDHEANIQAQSRFLWPDGHA